MKSSAKKVELASVDDLFSTEESRADAQREKVLEIPLSELHPFKDHPFKVKDDEAMMETADSIRQYGVLVPAIARPDPNGGYELVAGHRRHRASELAGKETMPVIVRDLDDDQATIIMVDSNLQRESLLPSERAFAYKMKLEAMKRQAGRPSKENCSQVGNDFGKKSSEVLAEQVGQSKNQIFRYIRLTELIPELLDMVDEKKIAFNPAYELSFLKKEEQVDLLDAMDSEQATPSLSQAQRLKKYSQEGHLTLDMMRVIMGEEKKVTWTRSPSPVTPCANISPGVTRPSGCRRPSSSCWSSGSASASNSTTAEKGEPMRDISARELKGHNILAVERFQDSTRWMIEFAVRKPRTPYGSPGDEVRLFLTEDGYRQALDAQRSQQIKIKRYAHVVEGHILDFKPKKKRRHP